MPAGPFDGPESQLGGRSAVVVPRHRCFLFEDHPAVKGVTVPRSGVSSGRSQLVDEVSSFLFRRSWRRSFLGAAPGSQFHAGPSGGQKAQELAGAGLKGSRRESMCQAAIKSLRATADFAGFFPWRAETRR